MNIDDLYKNDIAADLAELRADVENLEALQSAGEYDRFHAAFGRFASTLYHVTEKAEKFHGVPTGERWVFINGKRAVALCYEIGTRHKHGQLDSRYIQRRKVEIAAAAESVNAVYTVAMPVEFSHDTGDARSGPEARLKPKSYFKIVTVDGNRLRATEVARDALTSLSGWLAGRKIAC